MARAIWLTHLTERLATYLQTLRLPKQAGRFLPCLHGLMPEGKTVELGFSCFALKIYYTLGLWEKLYPQERKSWIDFLKSFQARGVTRGEWVAHNAFIDEPIITYLGRQTSWYKSLIDRVFYPNRLTYLQRVIIAETKQALATLAQVGECSDQPYRGFPITEKKVNNYLSNLDWTQP